MGRMSWPSGLTGAAVAGAAVGAVAALLFAGLATPASSLGHAPIHVRRNPDGTLRRGLRGEMQSTNWSGYAVAGYVTKKSYTSAQVTWVVPAVAYGKSSDTTNSSEYSANWVGIGGFCENALCTKVDRTLIQLGTEQDVSPSGGTDYYAWYEILPNPEIALGPGYPVSPGDSMTATLSCGTTCSEKKQSWRLSMSDSSRGWGWSGTFKYGSSKASAEWIEEAPYRGGVLPLANFATAAFSAASGADGASPSLTVSVNGIQMADPWGQTSNPSGTNSSDAFNMCWGFGSFTSCSSP